MLARAAGRTGHRARCAFSRWRVDGQHKHQRRRRPDRVAPSAPNRPLPHGFEHSRMAAPMASNILEWPLPMASNILEWPLPHGFEHSRMAAAHGIEHSRMAAAHGIENSRMAAAHGFEHSRMGRRQMGWPIGFRYEQVFRVAEPAQQYSNGPADLSDEQASMTL